MHVNTVLGSDSHYQIAVKLSTTGIEPETLPSNPHANSKPKGGTIHKTAFVIIDKYTLVTNAF